MPTLIEPLREQWGDIRGAAETLLRQGKTAKALREVQAFHYQLCQTRVLDPACGSANFLYVALEHMKRLEGEVLGFLSELTQGQGVLESEGLTVDPHQFLGLEINPRAAQIAELVLWIGYLQWHYRLSDRLDLPEPILRDFKNIECRDALIGYESREPRLNENGEPVTIWDGISMKVNPTTGELIPDETGRATVYRYHSPQQSEWPKADYIVGNPPFIGASTMRRSLGDGYVDSVRLAYKGVVPDSADFVMYWWHKAAEKVRHGKTSRFGFITTNSLRQTFNRKVLEPHLSDGKRPLSLAFAIPDHPWVDSNDGAAVRIAMTVGLEGIQIGNLKQVVNEMSNENREARDVLFNQNSGRIFSDLTIGANAAGACPLLANEGLAIKGLELGSQGFLISKEHAVALLRDNPTRSKYLKPYMNGRDLTLGEATRYVIDFHGLDEVQARDSDPYLFQLLIDNVKPERQVNREKRTSSKWWLFRRSGAELRRAVVGINRYIATTRTAKHRVFQFQQSTLIAESKIVVIASDDPCTLGVVSSRLHTLFAARAGGWLGVGNDSTYNHLDCFIKFPFPDLARDVALKIGKAAERLDTHRKRQQTEHPDLTLTGMYNVLEKLRAGEELIAKDKIIHEHGLASILGELHDDLDRAVFEAYGWSDLADKLVGRPGATTPLPDKPAEQAKAEEELLMRLVALNKRRAQEEAQGVVRWLRPDYQAPDTVQQEVDITLKEAEAKPEAAASKGKTAFPKAIPDQLRVLREALAERSHTTDSLAEMFKRKPRKSVEEGLQSLVAVGVAEFESESQTWHTV
jgi:hypothetical protein